jgi:hypothetical protein
VGTHAPEDQVPSGTAERREIDERPLNGASESFPRQNAAFNWRKLTTDALALFGMGERGVPLKKNLGLKNVKNR